MFAKSKAHPLPVGTGLSPEEREKISKTLYNRFHYEYGITPQYGDNPRVTELMRKTVSEVLDALDINGYKLVKVSNNGST